LKPWGEGGKRTFFLVNTVPLVSQQVGNLLPFFFLSYPYPAKWGLHNMFFHQVVIKIWQFFYDRLAACLTSMLLTVLKVFQPEIQV
jgi:hypothetical protein